LLRARRKRPRNRHPAEKIDELAPPHSTLACTQTASEYQMIALWLFVAWQSPGLSSARWVMINQAVQASGRIYEFPA
jgi:hypothetical protein